MAGDHFQRGGVELQAKQPRGAAGVARHIGPHALRLGVDVDAHHRGPGQAGGGRHGQARLGGAAAGAEHDGGRGEALGGALLRDLQPGGGIADRAERAGDAVGHQEGPASVLAQPVHQGGDGAVAVAGPGHVVQHGAEQAVQQGIAGGGIGGPRGHHPAVVHGEMAGEPKLGGGGGHLALAVGLHDTAGDQRVRPLPHRLVQHEVELAQLVAAQATAAQVLPLHPQARAAEMGGKPGQGLQRRGKVGQAQARKTGKAPGQLGRGGHDGSRAAACSSIGSGIWKGQPGVAAPDASPTT